MNRKTILIIAAAMMGTGFLLLSVGKTAKTSIEDIIFGETKPGDDVKVNDSIALSEFNELTIDAGIVDVYIEKGDDYRFEYTTLKRYIPEVNQDGDKLNIKPMNQKKIVSSTEALNFHVTWHDDDEDSVYRITVPKDIDKIKLDINSKTEALYINGVNIEGKINSINDDVTISNASSDNIEVVTEGGKITINNSDFGKLKINSGEDAVIENCNIKDLEVESTSDAVELNNIKLDNAKIEADDDITVRIDGENDYSFDFDIRAGANVFIDGKKMDNSFESENASGKSVTAKSHSGDINIFFTGK